LQTNIVFFSVVTAGVLRGEKSRFQLFGDTVRDWHVQAEQFYGQKLEMFRSQKNFTAPI
jgi:hypothetical protein